MLTELPIRLPRYIRYRAYGEPDRVIIYNLRSRAVHELLGTQAALWMHLLGNSGSDALTSELHRRYLSCNHAGSLERLACDFHKSISETVLSDHASFPHCYEDPVQAMKDEANSVEHAIYDAMAGDLIPYTATWEVTDRCNLECLHCCCDCQRREHEEWDLASFLPVLHQLRELGGMYIEFTGGECTLNPNLLAMAELASDEHFIFDVLTNGTNVTAALAEALSRLYPRVVKVSIYGANAECHDRFTGVRGSFERMLRGVHFLMDAGISPHLNCGVTKANMGEVENIWRLARDLDLPIRFAYHTTSSMNPYRDTKQLLCIDDRSLDQYFVDPRLSPLRPKIAHHEFRSDGRICDAGFRNICLGADGSVYACDSLRVVAGNVHEQSLASIWRDAAFFQEWRRLSCSSFSGCDGCSKLSVCQPCPCDYHLDSGALDGIDEQTCFLGHLCWTLTSKALPTSTHPSRDGTTSVFTEKACWRFLPRVDLW